MADEHDEALGVARGTAGRPRDTRIAERVLAATRDSLIELGWERTSIRGVAERAGVSRPAIARRWPSKTHLVLEAILGAAPDLDAFDGADTAGWISAVIAGSFDIFDRPEVRAAAPGLMATLRDHPDIQRALWQGFSGPASALVNPLGTGTLDAAGGPNMQGPATDRLVEAQAAIVLAAGAALFLGLVVGGDDRVRDRVRTALSASMAEILDLEN